MTDAKRKSANVMLLVALLLGHQESSGTSFKITPPRRALVRKICKVPTAERALKRPHTVGVKHKTVGVTSMAFFLQCKSHELKVDF